MNWTRHYSYFVILIAAACVGAGAIQVERNSHDKISFRLEHLSFLSEKAKKELKSGISTRVIILAKLIELPEKLIQNQVLVLDSKYDLWEEVFYVTISNGDKATYKNQTELEALIEAPGPFELGSRSLLHAGATYQISTVETVNPVSTERFASVQRWLTLQKLSVRGLPSSKDSASTSADLETPFTALFYTLWKRASSGEALSGELRVERHSDKFTFESLKERLPKDHL
jgi:hypothetical protein